MAKGIFMKLLITIFGTMAFKTTQRSIEKKENDQILAWREIWILK